jgi:uncharacterized protein
LTTVVIKSIDRAGVNHAVLNYAQQIRRDYPEITRIIWFGSWINGQPIPGSDVDLCLILIKSDKPFRDRASSYLPVGFPVGLDLFVYTEEEFELLGQLSPAWKQEILKGMDL